MREFQALSAEERRARAARERPAWAEIDRLYWADAKGQFNLDVVARRADPARPPWRETARQLACPVLLITGDPDRGGIVTPEVAEEARGFWRAGRVVHVPGTGHNIRREDYEPYRAAVEAFLRETAGA